MIKRIGVIGAGQMGSGIAHVCALKGFDIRLADVDQAHIDKGIDAIGRNMDRQIGRGMIRPEDKDAALRRISTATDYKPFADCDLIVEAATENEGVKREIFKKVCEGLPSNVLLATNTSSISVTRLASVTDRPGKFMGMHFMNPVPMMGLVELIRGIATEEETFRTVREVEEAKDAAQEAWIKAYRALATFRPGAKFATWIFTICYRVCCDRLAKRKRYSGEEPPDFAQRLLRRR